MLVGVLPPTSQSAKEAKPNGSVEEIFATVYILYTRYYNPYTKKESDIFDVMETIVEKINFISVI